MVWTLAKGSTINISKQELGVDKTLFSTNTIFKKIKDLKPKIFPKQNGLNVIPKNTKTLLKIKQHYKLETERI